MEQGDDGVHEMLEQVSGANLGVQFTFSGLFVQAGVLRVCSLPVLRKG
jgi:hypothetical protein